MREYGSQAVVWQTAINPVVALELLADGTWSGSGVLGPEALPPKPFLDLLAAPTTPIVAPPIALTVPSMSIGALLLKRIVNVRY